MGIFQWVQGKVSSIYEGVKTTLSVVSDVVLKTGQLLTTDSFRQGFANWFMQTWEGFERVLKPSIMVSLLTRPKTARVWLQGEATALARIIPVIIYQAGIRPLVGPAVRATVGSHPWVEVAAVGAVDLAAGLYFTRNAIRGAADNMACNMAMAKASTVESTMTNPPDGPLTHSCSHDSITQVTAGFNSSIYYYGNSIALYALACSLPYGEYLTLPLQALFYGRCFMEYPLGAAGNCQEHRLEVLNKNNPYILGFGASFLAMHRGLQYLICNYLGSAGFFIDEALSSLLSLHFIMVANLSRNLPLPGTEPGIDPFYQGRMLTDSVLAQTVSYVEKQYQEGEESDWYQDLKKNMQGKWDLPAVRALRYALLDENLQDCEKIALRSTARLYLELCGADIQSAIESVISMREDSYYKTVDYFKNVLPTVMSEDRKKLSIIMNKYLDQPLHDWLDFIIKVQDPKFGTSDQRKPMLYAGARKLLRDQQREQMREQLKEQQKEPLPLQVKEPENQHSPAEDDSVRPERVISGSTLNSITTMYGVARKRFENGKSMPAIKVVANRVPTLSPGEGVDPL